MTIRERLYLALVAVLPLHAVFLSAWISWKPFLILTGVLAVWDLVDGLRSQTWPWHRRVSLALALFLAVVATGFPAPEFRERFIRLFLALVVGGLVMLVTERALAKPGMLDRVLSVTFWTAAVMGLTALAISVVLVGVAGDVPINYLTGAAGYDLPLVDRVAKPAYLLSHFLALSNWHQDPGYGAAWGVLWSTLALLASIRGLGTRRPWLDGVVIGSLWLAVVMGFARTGWVSLIIAVILVSVYTIRRRLVTPGALARRLGAAALITIVLLAGLFAVDVADVGGDLDIQFAFRFQQGWDFLADLTGLFESSEAFEDVFSETEQRADVWPEYWRFFLSDPITGVGLGVGWETNSVGQEPHNLLLQLGAESGIVGIAAFAVLLAAIVGAGAGYVGGLAMLTSFLPSMTQTVLFEPSWWFAAGLYLGGKVGKEERSALESTGLGAGGIHSNN
ncbi:MAG: O-antigen ligase family protein [Acidimicrobiia bacterium]